MAERILPSPEQIAQLLDYDPATGKLFWRAREVLTFLDRRFNTRHAGGEAGCLTSNGYVRVKIHRQEFAAHRVVWILHHGTPPVIIDHINGDRTDNRIENLREVTNAENGRNAKRWANNKTGVSGVTFQKGRYRVRFFRHGKGLNGGSYKTLSEAIEARATFAATLGFHPNHGRD